MIEALAKNESVERFRTDDNSVLLRQMKMPFSVSGIKRFMPVEETAEYTGLSVYYLRQGIRTGKIPFVKCGCKSMINIPKLIELLDAESEERHNADI